MNSLFNFISYLTFKFVFFIFSCIFLFWTFLFTWTLGFFLCSITFIVECCTFWMKLIDHKLDNHIFFEEIEWCTLINCTLHCLFLLSPFHYSLLDCSFCDKLIDIYISALADSMSSICGLSVHGWIPIVIIKNDRISSCKGHTKSS